MITAGLFRERVADGRIGKTGKFRIMLSMGRHIDADQLDVMLRRGDGSRIMSFEELLSILRDLEIVLGLIPEMLVTVMKVLDTGDVEIVAMGAVDGWAFIKKHTVQIMENDFAKE